MTSIPASRRARASNLCAAVVAVQAEASAIKTRIFLSGTLANGRWLYLGPTQ